MPRLMLPKASSGCSPVGWVGGRLPTETVSTPRLWAIPRRGWGPGTGGEGGKGERGTERGDVQEADENRAR